MSREKVEYRNKYHDSDFETALDVYRKEQKKNIEFARKMSFLDWEKKFK